MLQAQLHYLAALHEATRLNAISWVFIVDDDRDLYRAVVGSNSIEIEYHYVPLIDGQCSDRYVATVSGPDIHVQAAIGTEVYSSILTMLSLQIFGWDKGQAGSIKGLTRATAKVEALIKSHMIEPN